MAGPAADRSRAASTSGMLTTLENYFLVSGEGSDTPIRVVDDSFIDAEKVGRVRETAA